MDHAIVWNESHLQKLLAAYFRYYNEDRLHCALDGDSPEGRPPSRASPGSALIALPRANGLHHRYEWREAA